jgi:hypothetical protein
MTARVLAYIAGAEMGSKDGNSYQEPKDRA